MPTTTRSPADSVASAVSELRALIALLPAVITDRVRLLTLELHRARNALALLVVLGLVATLMLGTAWFAMWAALAAWIVSSGVAWGWAALAVMMINLVVAVVLLLKARRLGPLVALPATARRLGVTPSNDAAAADTAASTAEAVS